MPATLAKKSSSVSGKRTTKVRPAPDFKKLHQQFLQKLEQGKACTKRPCTVVEEFDLSKGGTKTQFAEINGTKKTPAKDRKLATIPDNEVDKENCSPYGKFPGKGAPDQDIEFQPDKSALESILDNTGVTLETLYPKQPLASRQTVCGNAVNTPLQSSFRRQTAATENIRRSIFYTGNSVKPSPNRVYSEYTRHVLSLTQRHTLSNINSDQNVGASPNLNGKSVSHEMSPLRGRQLPRMSLFKPMSNQRTPTNIAPSRIMPSVKSDMKYQVCQPKRVLAAKSPCPTPSFKVPDTLPKSAKKPGIKWKDLLDDDMDRLQQLEKIEKDLQSDIHVIEHHAPSAQKTKKMRTTSHLGAISPSAASKKKASPKTPKSRSRTDALRNLSPIRTPGQQASPRRLPPRSPLVGKQHQASPKRKAEPFSRVTVGSDPAATPPRSKRPVRENDITPKSAARLSQLRSKQSPLTKAMKGESPVRAILGELSPSVRRRSPKHLNFNEFDYDVEDKENCSPEMLEDVQSTRDDDSFFLVEEEDQVDIPEEQDDEDVDQLNRTLNQSIAQMEDLEAQANKARRKTEDPDKLMEQLELIQKKQKELMQMQMDLQEKLIRSQAKKSQSKTTVSAPGPMKAMHAPTPSKRWRAQEDRNVSEQSAELSASAYSEDSENVTPLRKVLFPTSKREVHFQEEIDVCEITANDITPLSSESSSNGSGVDESSGSSSVFESPVEVKVYGHTGEINQTWITQSSSSVRNMPPIVSTATIPTATPYKSVRLGSIHSFSSVTSALPILSPLQIEIPAEDCGYPRSDSLLDIAHQLDTFTSPHHTLTTATTTFNSVTTPTKSIFCHSPLSPHTPSNRSHYSAATLSPSNISMSPLTISAKDTSELGSLSLSGNLSPKCRSPVVKSRSLLDRCLLAQAQHRYEEALADDEVSRYMNRLSAMPRAMSPTYRCQEPLSKILEEGDDKITCRKCCRIKKHVAPICKPVEEISPVSCFYPIVYPTPGAAQKAQ